MFRPINAGSVGIGAWDVDGSLPKTVRGVAGYQVGEVTGEVTPGGRDWGVRNPGDLSNAMFWKHEKKAGAFPRGVVGGYSFAYPARMESGGGYRPIQNKSLTLDMDFESRKDVTYVGFGNQAQPGNSPVIILSTTGHGERDPLAFGAAAGIGPLIAQHEGNGPPQYSTHVFEIDGDSPSPIKHAGLDTIFQVRHWAPPCSGNLTGDEEQYTIALVGDDSPEGQGFLHVTYGGIDALHSHLADGPLRFATNKHELVRNKGDGPLREGAIDINAKYTSGLKPYDAPLEFEEKPYPLTQKGPIPVEVDLLYDRRMDHGDICKGKVEGMWRWVAWTYLGETPPCNPTKDYDTTDANGNILRTYTENTRVYTDRKVQTQGIYLQSRSEVAKGRAPVDATIRRDLVDI